jgi:hypothetical protein
MIMLSKAVFGAGVSTVLYLLALQPSLEVISFHGRLGRKGFKFISARFRAGVGWLGA